MRDYHSNTAWIIKDWVGNLMNFGRFETFEDAEDFLSEKLDNNYETDRQEYYIIEDTVRK